MGLRSLALSWLRKAKRFIEVAKRDLDGGYYDISAFNAQQAAEMSLKAVLIAKTGYKPLTHSITELLDALSELLDVPDHIRSCSHIEEHYIQARYPDARLREYTREEAERAVRCGEAIVRYAEGLLEVGGGEGQEEG
ncbi:MAG: HEPN domain-containing protein [Candidatus Korarchaeota archaeon]|nr:HEPN domain-containing protein [Candidatus Korarchaeota archaeon]